ncbi:MAG: spondin domain-containing protein [Myxococcales bacterium]|nr:spondin domain-containing protein [Myxococcales bacterium]
MTKTALLGVLTLLVGAVISAGSPSVVVADDDDRRGKAFKVTVTNITRGVGADSGQILNGLVVASHNKHFRLFELGQPASEELALVAEDALNRALFDALSEDRNVCDVQTIGIVDPPTIFPILPGASASVVITVKGNCRYLSLAAMLVTTNDAFAALNGVRLYKRSDKLFALAYDAGSEANDEDCDHIPGPPCGDTTGAGDDGEGYVSIHSGIHGLGGGAVDSDLNPSDRDWRNPVAYITIDRVDDHDHDDDDD